MKFITPELASYVINGIEHGFRIGFSDDHLELKSATKNMRSALQHPEIISNHLKEELALARIAGPFNIQDFPQIHISRFGVIPKSTPGKWRLITDLSHPEGGSVNNGIHPSRCTLHYTSVDRVARSMQKYGKGALMAKIDVKSAYRLVPVHPDDRYLLGVKWEDQLYVDCMLPFGLRSAPVIYTAVVDAFEMILKAKGIEDTDNYVDDIITFGPPQSSTCQQNLTTILEESA